MKEKIERAHLYFVLTLINLIKVRSLMTMTAWATFLCLAVTGNISTDAIVGVINVLLGFYFGEKAGIAKEKAKAEEIIDE